MQLSLVCPRMGRGGGSGNPGELDFVKRTWVGILTSTMIPGEQGWITSAHVRKSNQISANLVPRASFPLTSGQKTRALGATISGMRHRCRCAVSRITRIRLFPLFFQNGCSQNSRFLPQARRIVGSGDENEFPRERDVCGSFMFSWMTTTGKRRKFSIILAPKRKYIPLMMWKMTIWTLWSLHRNFLVKICREYKKTCR